MGAFPLLASTHVDGLRAMFRYARRANPPLHPLAHLIAVLHSPVLALCTAAAFLLIALDWVSRIGEALRLYSLSASRVLLTVIRRKFLGFILNPALMLLLTPVFLVTVLVPKLSTNFDALT